MKKVLIAAPVHPVLTEGLASAGYQLVVATDITQQSGMELIRDCEGVITSTRLQLDKTLLDVAPMLKFIGRMGSGMEVIDVPYATSKGIMCFSSPEGNCNSVAEHVLGMLLAVNKRIAWSHEEIKKGKWLREENRGTELEGKTIGIIGYGHTGRALSKKLKAFDMKILVYDKYATPEPEDGIVVCQELSPILREADIVSFHVPIQNDTTHYFNSEFAKEMSKPFVLLNTSRGEVVDVKVLEEYMNKGKVKAACLDVWEEEPLDKMSENKRQILNDLIRLPNVLVTPHIAGYSQEALYKMSIVLLKRIIKHLQTDII